MRHTKNVKKKYFKRINILNGFNFVPESMHFCVKSEFKNEKNLSFRVTL